MKQLIDFIPLILFFVVYKMDPRMVSFAGSEYELGGPFSATMVLMVASILVYGALYIKNKTLEKSHVVTVAAVLLFGSMTLVFHDEAFLKWKAPIVNWVFAVAFLVSQYIGQKPLIQRMMDHALTLPDSVWLKMNLSWVVFFVFLGAANLFVAFTFHEIWVDFKIFGSLILTILFIIAQFAVISKYIRTEEK